MKLYTTHCPKCKVLEKKLVDKNIDFDVIEDVDTILKVGRKNKIMTAPLLEDNDGNVMSFENAVKFVNTL